MSYSPEKKIQLLLVDDDEDDRELYAEVIKEINAEIDIQLLSNEKELTHYLSQPETTLPDLIFLDINMPGKNGVEILEDLKANKKYKHIPVVMCTTSSYSHLIEKCKILGAYAYICKPNTMSIIREVLREILSADWAKEPGHTRFVLGL